MTDSISDSKHVYSIVSFQVPSLAETVVKVDFQVTILMSVKRVCLCYHYSTDPQTPTLSTINPRVISTRSSKTSHPSP